MTLETLQAEWIDEPEYHKHIHELFIDLVNNDDQLYQHRNFIENNVYGMGERSFQWLWKLLVDELPNDFKFIEIGVHKGQIISLIKLLATRLNKQCKVFGITPMDGTGTGWTHDDYEGDIIRLHKKFNLRLPTLYKGLSSDMGALVFARLLEGVNILYIDGGHERADIDNDLLHYAPMVKKGGFLVIDDACCDMHMPFGFFQGIQPVTDGLLAYMEEHGNDWEFVFSVVHLRIYKRK